MTLNVFLAPVCQLFTYVPEDRKKPSVHSNPILLSPRTHWTRASSKKISILQHGTHHVCVWERVIEASGGERVKEQQGPLRRSRERGFSREHLHLRGGHWCDDVSPPPQLKFNPSLYYVKATIYNELHRPLSGMRYSSRMTYFSQWETGREPSVGHEFPIKKIPAQLCKRKINELVCIVASRELGFACDMQCLSARARQRRRTSLAGRQVLGSSAHKTSFFFSSIVSLLLNKKRRAHCVSKIRTTTIRLLQFPLTIFFKEISTQQKGIGYNNHFVLPMRFPYFGKSSSQNWLLTTIVD